MENTQNIEVIYEYLDNVSKRLHDMDGTPYLEGLSYALDFLLDDDIPKTLVDIVRQDLETYKRDVVDSNFDKETVRKAVQLALLNGFKEMNITNSMMTPDSIGMFMGYILSRLYGKNASLNVYDPLVGTGNLLATLNNHFSENITFEGTEADPLLSALSRNFLDALDVKNQIYHQDALTFKKGPFDLIVTDFPVESKDRKETYFPYQVILHHMQNVKKGKFFLAVIENDFFEQAEAAEFKEKLMRTMHLYGLIKFDEGLFKNHPQSLLIMQRKHREDETIDDFLLADLPQFTDQEKFNTALSKIENWFNKQKG